MRRIDVFFLGLWVMVAMTLVSTAAFAMYGATATMRNAAGKTIGTADFKEVNGHVMMHLEVAHLQPGSHGIHVHEKGSCVPPDFASAGGHFNPQHKAHGRENPQGSHAGDLPNLIVDAQGKGTVHANVEHVTLGTGIDSLLHPGGTAVVIHEHADDNVTDPAGNSGARIACGVITRH